MIVSGRESDTRIQTHCLVTCTHCWHRPALTARGGVLPVAPGVLLLGLVGHRGVHVREGHVEEEGRAAGGFAALEEVVREVLVFERQRGEVHGLLHYVGSVALLIPGGGGVYR